MRDAEQGAHAELHHAVLIEDLAFESGLGRHGAGSVGEDGRGEAIGGLVHQRPGEVLRVGQNSAAFEGFVELDKAFINCFRRAKEKGELPESADPIVLGHLASATIHTIAIRSRAGVPRKELEVIVKGAIDVMVG